MTGTKRFWESLFNRPDDQRLQRLEAKVNLILEHIGVKLDDSPAAILSEEVKALALQPRKKFAAVKLHRQQTGAGLREAEAAVAAHIRTHRKSMRATTAVR